MNDLDLRALYFTSWPILSRNGVAACARVLNTLWPDAKCFNEEQLFCAYHIAIPTDLQFHGDWFQLTRLFNYKPLLSHEDDQQNITPWAALERDELGYHERIKKLAEAAPLDACTPNMRAVTAKLATAKPANANFGKWSPAQIVIAKAKIDTRMDKLALALVRWLANATTATTADAQFTLAKMENDTGISAKRGLDALKSLVALGYIELAVARDLKATARFTRSACERPKSPTPEREDA